MLVNRISATLCNAVPCIATVFALTCFADASSRRFTYSYETTTMAAGAMELESWVTRKSDMDADGEFERFDIRHEFEYGVTDRFQLAFYFADWRYEESADESGKTKFHDVALEAIYNLTDPNTSPFGSALYGEVKGSDDFIKLEGKLLLQKNVGDWMLVYNIGGEIEWKDRYENDQAELMQSAGLSYAFNPAWSAGLEFLHEMAVPDVEDFGSSTVYFGPNVAWRNGNFSLALTGMQQLTSRVDEPNFQIRTIIAIDF